jgi:hypothetical protein
MAKHDTDPALQQLVHAINESGHRQWRRCLPVGPRSNHGMCTGPRRSCQAWPVRSLRAGQH